ncbi:MAG: MFS transporter [Kofleriaceae bacterium]
MITNEQSRARATQILVVLSLINLVSYAGRNALFAVYPDLSTRYDIDYAQIGFLQTVFMIPHALATLPFGWAGDAYDRRKVIAFGVLLASVAGALGALGTSYVTLAGSRALVGLGTAAVVPVANSILGQLYSANKASRIAVFNLGLFLGGVVGFGVGAMLGFPLVVIALAVPGVALAIVIVKQPIATHEVTTREPVSRYLLGFTRRFIGEARTLLRIRTLRWLMLSTTAMAFAAGGYNAFMLEYLKSPTGKGMSEAAATNVLVIGLFGALAGIIVGGRAADALRARYVTGRLWMIAIGMAASIPTASLAIIAPPNIAIYVAGVATLFTFSLYHAPMAATVDDLAPPGKSVAAQGLVIGVMHLLGTAPSSWVLGEIADRTDLTIAMWIPTGILAIAAAAMMMATRSFARDRQVR